MLTINNIIWYKDDKRRITEVGNGYVKMGDIVATEVEGAIITPAFLRKNKWKQNVKAKTWRVGNDFAWVELSEIQDCWIVKISNQVYEYRGWINYIHELQQAMSVCAINFDWKL